MSPVRGSRACTTRSGVLLLLLMLLWVNCCIRATHLGLGPRALAESAEASTCLVPHVVRPPLLRCVEKERLEEGTGRSYVKALGIQNSRMCTLAVVTEK